MIRDAEFTDFSLLCDLQDEFKIVVVEAIQSLCLKFPQKHRVLMSFLSNILREEGGFEFKRAIVDSILCLIKAIPEAKESGLAHLSEFIEDCEFTYLSSQILHLLGDQGPTTSDPSKYIATSTTVTWRTPRSVLQQCVLWRSLERTAPLYCHR